MRQITIKFSNRVFYTFVLIGVLILAGVIVYAYGGNQPSVVGHSADEIEPPTGCSSNQVLQWSGSAWQCVNLLDPNSIQISGIGRMYDGELRGCQMTSSGYGKYQEAIRNNNGVLEIRISGSQAYKDSGWQRSHGASTPGGTFFTASLNVGTGVLSMNLGPSDSDEAVPLTLLCDLLTKKVSCGGDPCFYFDSWTDLY